MAGAVALRMNRHAFYILDSICENQVPLNFFFSEDKEGLLNKPDHRLSNSEFLAVLEQLIRAGLIALNETDHFVRNLATRKSARETLVSMTAKGGDAWAQLTFPQWSDYYVAEWDWCWLGQGASNRTKASMLVLQSEHVDLLEQMLSQNELLLSEVGSATTGVRAISDWKPLYWKSCRPAYEVLILSAGIQEPSDFEFLPSQFWACFDDVYGVLQ